MSGEYLTLAIDGQGVEWKLLAAVVGTSGGASFTQRLRRLFLFAGLLLLRRLDLAADLRKDLLADDLEGTRFQGDMYARAGDIGHALMGLGDVFDVLCGALGSKAGCAHVGGGLLLDGLFLERHLVHVGKVLSVIWLVRDFRRHIYRFEEVVHVPFVCGC